ncbi:MAG: CbiX/SirB N-terminal domain-containing protein, partial [Alphaproteobacteria bacterium]
LNAYAVRRRQVDPDFRIDYGRDLGIDPKMLRAAVDRIAEALADHPDVPAQETLLVVVGRGASDPDANGNVAKITRLLWESFGFGWAETAYSGVTFPLVEPALEKAVKLGYRRIIVFPYFLFTGVLVSRIYSSTDQVAARYPELEFIKAAYLNDHPAVIETFIERVGEIVDGDTAMNCQMCKYRTQVPGFEADVGRPQESHHHHVEGVGSGCELCDADGVCNGRCQVADHHHGQPHDHAHDHSHDHGHSHPIYPHADHPLGPRTLKPPKASE